MTYDFDTYTDRTGTDALKCDFTKERGKPEGVLPLWVADMDFRAPQCVIDALTARAAHGIFGYTDTKDTYDRAVLTWFKQRFGYAAEPEWIVKTPGVLYALAVAVRAFTKPGEAVLVQPPVYYPFFSVIRDNDRVIVENPLVYEDGAYHIDFEDFERKITENGVKLFLLCSPHNPVGRVWRRDELKRLGEICARHGVTVVSDEIHCDFAFPEHPHTVFTDAAPEMRAQSLICTAPSKTFNLAGLQTSNIFIQDPVLRRKFRHEIDASGYSQLNTMGLLACRTAYENAQAAEWLEAVKTYMRGNLDFLRGYLNENIPEIRLVEPEGTYFAWLDCSGFGLSDSALEDLVLNKAGLWLDGGGIFSKQTGQFQRVALASPRGMIREAAERLKNAVDTLRSEQTE